MHLRTVQALVVVLDHDLPVGLHLVHEAHADAQLVHLEALERGDRLGAVGERRHERALRAAGRHVHEHEPGVVVDRDVVQRVVGPVEVLVFLHVGRADQLSVQVERPRVVRADERLAHALGALDVVEELRAAVAADVVEGAQLAGVVAHDEDRLARDVAHDVVAGVRDLLGAPDADPLAPPDLLALVLPDLGARVVGAAERRTRLPLDLVVADLDLVLGLGHGGWFLLSWEVADNGKRIARRAGIGSPGRET